MISNAPQKWLIVLSVALAIANTQMPVQYAMPGYGMPHPPGPPMMPMMPAPQPVMRIMPYPPIPPRPPIIQMLPPPPPIIHVMEPPQQPIPMPMQMPMGLGVAIVTHSHQGKTTPIPRHAAKHHREVAFEMPMSMPSPMQMPHMQISMPMQMPMEMPQRSQAQMSLPGSQMSMTHPHHGPYSRHYDRNYKKRQRIYPRRNKYPYKRRRQFSDEIGEFSSSELDLFESREKKRKSDMYRRIYRHIDIDRSDSNLEAKPYLNFVDSEGTVKFLKHLNKDDVTKLVSDDENNDMPKKRADYNTVKSYHEKNIKIANEKPGFEEYTLVNGRKEVVFRPSHEKISNLSIAFDIE